MQYEMKFSKNIVLGIRFQLSDIMSSNAPRYGIFISRLRCLLEFTLQETHVAVPKQEL